MANDGVVTEESTAAIDSSGDSEALEVLAASSSEVGDDQEQEQESSVAGEVEDGSEAEVAESESSGLSESVLAQAREYGLDESDLAGLDDEKAERVFAAMDRRLGTARNAEDPPKSAPAPAEPEPYLPRLSEADILGDDPKLDDLDENVSSTITATRSAVRKAVEHQNKLAESVEAQLNQAAQAINNMVVEREVEYMDRYIDGLGDDGASEYGKGGTLDLQSESPSKFKKRAELYQHAKMLQQSHIKLYGKPLTINEAIKRSHGALHGSKKSNGAVAVNKTAKLDKRKNMMSEKPGRGARDSVISGDEAALKALQGIN